MVEGGVGMRMSWYRKLFPHPAKTESSAVRARAEAGDAQAQVAMAVTCSCETDGAADLGGAAEWYRKAAAQNDAQAQFDLGMLCAEGRGVPCDDPEAFRWLQKAAHQGHADAQYQLGVRCRRATFGQPRSESAEARIEAYKWLLLAANQGSREAVAAWEQMALDMPAEEVAEGNLRAGQFASSTTTSIFPAGAKGENRPVARAVAQPEAGEPGRHDPSLLPSSPISIAR
jgi:TPR repeat protein